MKLSFNSQSKNYKPAFGDYNSIVARESYREFNNFIGIALKLTGEDLKSFQPVLKAFKNKNLEKDVLSINVQGFNGDFDSPFGIYINHHDVYKSKKNSKIFDKSWQEITHLMARLAGDEKINTPINKSPEEEKMMKALLGDSGYTFDEEEELSGGRKWTINKVAGSLRYIIDEIKN